MINDQNRIERKKESNKPHRIPEIEKQKKKLTQANIKKGLEANLFDQGSKRLNCD